MSSFTLHAAKTALLVVDMQEKIATAVIHQTQILNTLCLLIEGFKILNLPILLTEQYPKGLGPTLKPIQELLKEHYHPWIKTTFSSLDHPPFLNHISALSATQWVVVGVETHICILQTVKSLVQQGKEVVVLNDVTSSRSQANHLTALQEIRQAGARVSCFETILFELTQDSTSPHFKAISQLVKTNSL